MAQTNGHVRVIVLLNTASAPTQAKPDAAAIASIKARVAAAQNTVLANHFGDAVNLRPGQGFERHLTRFEITPGFAVTVDATELEALAADPLVKSINIDRAMPPTLLQSLPLIGQPTAYTNGATGAGWAVAVLDTGVQANHEFLSGKVIAEACFSNANGGGGGVSLCPNGLSSQTGAGAADSTTANCINGSTNLCQHGTHVSGIAAGLNTSQSTGEPTNGVARDAKIFAIQIFTRFNDSGSCGGSAPCVLSYTSDQVLALDYVYQHLTPVAGVNVASINMSLGGGPDTSSACDSDPQKPSIDNLRAAGVLTAIAAGNDGSTTLISHPGCISSAVAVASSTKSDMVSLFSNMATIVALIAPGGMGGGPCSLGGNNPDILSSVAATTSATTNLYACEAGTSMATPHVAGAIAAIRTACPNATAAAILSALQSTGVSITDTRPGAPGNITKSRIQLDAALASLNCAGGTLVVAPTSGISASGPIGGPFSPSSFNYTLTATAGTRNFSISGVPSWLTASSTSGSATTSGTTVTFTVNASANSLAEGAYTATITFTDTTSNTTALTTNATLNIGDVAFLQVGPSTNMASVGNPGGPFSPSSFQYQLSTNNGTAHFSISGLPSWLDASSTSGTVTTSPITITFTVNSNANSLAIGGYNATISFTNTTNGNGDQTRNAALTVNSGGTASPAQRTWVSATGNDNNDCTLTAPCQTFAGAIAKTAAGGEIDCLDAGDFGTVTVTKSITLDCNGWGSILSPNADAIVISGTPAAASVTIRNLSVNGAATGLNGIRYLSGSGALHIENVQVFGFTQNGIDFENTVAANLFVRRSQITGNLSGGILVKPSGGVLANVSLYQVRADHNLFGLRVQDGGKATVEDSIAYSNQGNGFVAVSKSVAAEINLVRSIASNTLTNGVATSGALAIIRMYHSAVTDNGTGINTAAGGTIATTVPATNVNIGNGTPGAFNATVAVE